LIRTCRYSTGILLCEVPLPLELKTTQACFALLVDAKSEQAVFFLPVPQIQGLTVSRNFVLPLAMAEKLL
jgi:hypothetical protein